MDKQEEKKLYEYVEATTNAACRGWSLGPWGRLELETWRTAETL